MKNIIVLLAIFISSINYSQNQVLLNETWFVNSAKDSNVSNNIIDVIQNTRPELRFEVTFLSDKIVLEGCCGGTFEMDVNYLGNTEIEIINLNEIETSSCNDNYVSVFYNRIKGAFTGMINQNISYNINFTEILNFSLDNPLDGSFVLITNAPGEYLDYPTEIYWGHDPPIHQWSLTQVTYQGQTMDLPYGAALTDADVYEGTFIINLCGDIFVALNSSWMNDVIDSGPCFISCGILENTIDACDPVAGYNMNYLENFKQTVFNILNDNINQTMFYTFTFGSARKLIIEGSSQSKLVFHSNNTYLSTPENNLQPEITIYPNPVNDSLSIYTTFCELCTVKIYNPNGKLLYTESLKASQDKIDVKQLSNGIYFIVVENELGIRQAEKFVKK